MLAVKRACDPLRWIPRQLLVDFSKAIELDPMLRQAYENKAHVLAEILGETEKGIQALDDAVDRFPEYALARSSPRGFAWLA